jgi:hypothetical protein
MPKFLTNIEILTTPSDPNHAARLQDVADIAGEYLKKSVRVVSTTNLTGTYSTLVLTGSGVAALPTIDGVTLAVSDRVLVAGQSDKTQNGIYTVTVLGDGSTTAWKLTRADDFDASSEIFAKMKVRVNQGTSSHDQIYTLITAGPFTLDTTPLEFEVASGLIKMIAQHVSTITGDGTTTAFSITHGWGTFDVTAEVIDNSDHATVGVNVIRPTNNTVEIIFGDPPTSSQTYNVILRADQ